MSRILITTFMVIAVFLSRQVSADNLRIPDLSNYPLGIVQLPVGESLTMRALAEVGARDTLPVDIVLMIDDSQAMREVITQLANEWQESQATLPATLFSRWDTHVGIYAYNVSSSRLIADLTPAAESVFETKVLIGWYWEGTTKVNLYAPLYEAVGDGSPSFGIDALYKIANLDSWRNDAVRVIFSLMDSNFKQGPLPSIKSDIVKGFLIGGDFTFSGLMGPGPCCGGIEPGDFTGISGGSVTPVAEYSSFVSEMSNALDALLPFEYSTVSIRTDKTPVEGIDVNVECVAAATGGSCSSDIANGTYLRTQSEDFEFDITFTATQEGAWLVPLDLMVDGKVTKLRKVVISVGPPILIFGNDFED